MNKIIIESDKLQHNINIVLDKVKNLEVVPTIIGVLKGNGYGMGILILAKKLIDNGINFFAVSSIDEAKVLRDAGYTNPILLLESTLIEEEIYDIIDYNLIATVGSYESVKKINELAEKQGKVVEAHLKIDTGFGRFGFVIKDNDVSEILKAFDGADFIKVTGTYSHFIESYSNNSKLALKQFNDFMNVVALLKVQNFDVGMLHICNSSAFFKYPYMYLDAVRIGSAFTGRLQISNRTSLKRIGYLESDVCEIKKLPKGYNIGYSATAKLKKDSKVAIVLAGYADGVGVSGPKDSVRFIDKLRKLKVCLKSFFNNERFYVVINNRRYPVLGRIGMKNLMIDVTDSDVKVGDKVKIEVRLGLVNNFINRQER